MYSKQELESYLQQHKISVRDWGKGESKTLDDLWQELDHGESRLEESGDRVVRFVTGVGIDVYYVSFGIRLKLFEEKQVFTDGRPRERKLSTSVGEKMRPRETAQEAAARALLKELSITGVAIMAIGVEDRHIVRSDSFPGLWTKNTVNLFECWLPPELFNSKGYIEVQDGKTSYFKWRFT